MKNKHITIVALAAAALATSCASEDIAEPLKQNQGEHKTVTLTASVNEAQTRVGMTKDGSYAKFYWHNDDKILVQTVNGDTYSGVEFTTTANTGDKTAKFTGEIAEGKVAGYAVYPYDSESHKHSFTGEKGLTYVLPSTYTSYTPETKIFSTDADYPTTSTNMPMLGTISTSDDSKSISFKCLGGLAVIRIDKMPTASGTLTVTASEQLSGNFTVSDLSATDAQIVNTNTAGNNGNTVTFNFNNATTNGVGVFYLPLATGSYTNVKIVLNSGKVNQTINYGNLTVNRAGVTAIPVVANRIIDGHVFVDLGLSVLWAETNVGASTATGEDSYGSYFAWGETTDYSSSNYKYGASVMSLSKYSNRDKKVTLETSDDTAAQNWGTSCRMPTNAEFSELISSDNCDWKWDDTNKGYTVTSKKKGYTSNSIFLPASGYYNGGSSLDGKGSNGYYWSSSRCEGTASVALSAYYLSFNSGDHKNNSDQRNKGLSVRPVAKK